MAIPYRPRGVSNERGVYLFTCKSDHAQAFVDFLNHEGIIATLSSAETTENMESGDEEECYAVQQVDIASPVDSGKAKHLIDKWCTLRP